MGSEMCIRDSGSYTFGNCNPDDAEAGWVGRQLEWEEEEPDDEPKTGSPSDDPADDDPADDGSTGSVPFDPWYDETEESEEGEDTDMVLLPPAKGCSTSAGRGDTVSWTKWAWEMLRRR